MCTNVRTMKKYTTVAEYLQDIPAQTIERIDELQAAIKAAVPKADEVISYNMPAYKLNGKALVYFAAYAKHVGFYPTASPMVVFADELSKYKTSKGAIQFPLDKKIPAALVKKIVKYRIAEEAERAAAKKK
jgi:uncharacterized protein YdhG (YjbR/CyaY superfamily)